jgi:Response regulator containing a CheY-like receiver domain and a GGDEF domain
MAKILVADVAATNARLVRVLEGRHEMHFATTMEEALSTLKERAFDLIICGMDFDESQMIELLRTVKGIEELANTRFICLRVGIPAAEEEQVLKLARFMGACKYIALETIESRADADLLGEIEACLPREIIRSR